MATGQQQISLNARTWCRVIAWIHMIQSLVLLVLLALVLAAVFNAPPTPNKVPLELDAVIGWFYFGFALLLVILEFACALLLLKGANERNGYYLRLWIIFSCILFVLNIFTLVGPKFWLISSSLIFSAMFNGLSILVVLVAYFDNERSVNV